MALKGPGTTLKKSPYGDPTKASPYGKLPTKSVKKPKKENSSTESSSNKAPGEGVALTDVFGVLADENGRITSAKLRTYVKELGLDFSEEEVKEMMQVVDPAGKGEVSFNNLLGVVRDFSHEFPSVKLTEEELTREITSLSTITASTTQESTTTDTEENPSTSVEDVTETEPIEKTETEAEEPKVVRPKSSRERIAEIAKKAIEDLDDKMSVIREDEEFDDPDNVEEDNEQSGNSDKQKENENEDDLDNVFSDGNKELPEKENKEQNDTETGSVIDNSVMVAKGETVSSRLSSEGTFVSVGNKSEPEDSKDGDVTDAEYADTDNVSTRASTVEEHRLDSAISTAIGREQVLVEDEADNKDTVKNSRRRSMSQNRNRSRKGSVQKDTLRRTNRSRERSKSRSRKPSDDRRKQIETEQQKYSSRKKFNGVDDPNFYSTMGCSLKLSQIRTRQRILYVMWRAVYDEALRKTEQEKAKQKAKRRTSRS